MLLTNYQDIQALNLMKLAVERFYLLNNQEEYWRHFSKRNHYFLNKKKINDGFFRLFWLSKNPEIVMEAACTVNSASESPPQPKIWPGEGIEAHPYASFIVNNNKGAKHLKLAFTSESHPLVT